MKRETVRRSGLSEIKRIQHREDNPVRYLSAHNDANAEPSPSGREKKDGGRRSPSILARVFFVAACACSVHLIIEIKELRQNRISLAEDHKVKQTWDYFNHQYRPSHESIQQKQTGNLHVGYPYGPVEPMRALEAEVESILKQSVISCQRSFPRDAKSYENNNPCPAHKNSGSNGIVIYNPSTRDKFICKGKILLGPKKFRMLDKDEDCWKRPIETLLLARSFPVSPTYENRGTFPGIVVEATPSNQDGFDDTFSSNYVSKRILLSSADPSSSGCDVKCDFQPLTGGVQLRYIYGTDWEFTLSMEGEKYYSDLEIDKNAWKDSKFFATTSFRSEVPLPYFSFAEYNIQNPPVSFEDGIKGASFLARNCGSMNDREEVVQKLMKTAFRIDSLSSCLNNMEPNAMLDTSDKGRVMRKYLFHLAFENQNTNDYITEKLWGALSSGTLPVYLGAPNVKDHVPFKGVIFVDDFPSVEALAKYLIKVSNDKKLYESYHSWREEPLPQSFLTKYNMSHTHSKCRTCRWAHARKYGLGWNHNTQSLESVLLPRETCVKANHMASPAVESWWVADPGNHASHKLELKTIGESESLCPFFQDDISRARLENSDMIRSVWSNDGTTDILIEGEAFYSHTLRLAFPLQNHEAPQYIENHTLWIQDNRSRVSLVLSSNAGFTENTEIVTVLSGVFQIHVTPEVLPVRIRIIVENLDTFHEGAIGQPSYYGDMMANDITNHPQLFSIERLSELKQYVSMQESSDRALLQFPPLHMKSVNNGQGSKKRQDI